MYFPTVFVKVKKEKINWARKLMEERIERRKEYIQFKSRFRNWTGGGMLTKT